MPANPDFRELFSIFNDEGVEYLVVGAHAVIFFAEPRYTKDLDILVRAMPENAERVHRALARFGAPLEGVRPRDFLDQDMIYQVGVAPNRIDIIMSIAGVTFDEAWKDRAESTYDGVPIRILGRESLLRAKRASGRPQDLLDVANLLADREPASSAPALPPAPRPIRDYIGDLRERYEAWWRGESRAPLLYMIHPRPGHEYPGDAVRPWMAPAKVSGWTAWEHEFVFGQAVELAAGDGDLRRVDEAIALLARYADATDVSGAGYPFLFVNLGASMLSAFLTGVTRFDGQTIWLELDEEWSLDRIAELEEATAAPYARVAMESVRRLAERLDGRFIFGMPDFGSPLDILAAMRKAMNLLVDTADEPEKVDVCVERLARIYWHWHARFHAILDPRNAGCWTHAMRLLSGRPADLGTCDFSAMISPSAFDRWHAPFLREQVARHPGRVVFHIDGPGEIPHLDRILSLPSLGAVQWVPGAGKPGGLDPCWDGLYRRILDAGKNVQLCGGPRDPERLKAFFAKFPAGRFFVQPPVSSRAEAEGFLRAFQ